MTNDILYTIKNPKVTFNQRLKDMAKIAENSIELVEYTEKSKEYFANGAMMDMFEGKKLPTAHATACRTTKNS